VTFSLARQIVMSEKPDLVHTHKIRGLSPSIWSAASGGRRHKDCAYHHDFELLSPQGLLQGWVGRLAMNRSPLLHPYQAIRRLSAENVQSVAAPSRFVLGATSSMGFFQKAKAAVIAELARVLGA